MIRTYEKPTAFALSVSYDNLLPVDTVANLKEGFGMLGMRFTGQPRKAEIASMYADYVRNHPAEVLQRLTLESLTQISQILQKGKGGCVTLNGINLFTQLQKTNLVVTWENEYEGKSYLYLIDEFHDLFAPYIEEALKHPATEVGVYVGAKTMDEIVNKVRYRCKETVNGITRQLKSKFPGEMTASELDAFEKQVQGYQEKLRQACLEFQVKYNTRPSAYIRRDEEMQSLVELMNTAQRMIEEMRDMIEDSKKPLEEHIDTLLSRPQIPTPQPHPNLLQWPHKVGRNDPCPCGSGKKYKHCHGR